MASGCGHWVVEPGVWEERVMEGWPVEGRVEVHQVVRAEWVCWSRQRILLAEERERRL